MTYLNFIKDLELIEAALADLETISTGNTEVKNIVSLIHYRLANLVPELRRQLNIQSITCDQVQLILEGELTHQQAIAENWAIFEGQGGTRLEGPPLAGRNQSWQSFTANQPNQ